MKYVTGSERHAQAISVLYVYLMYMYMYRTTRLTQAYRISVQCLG